MAFYAWENHTPLDYVVNSCLQRVRGSFPRDVPRIHDGRSSDQHTLTPVISTRCNFTTKSREIWNFLTGKSSTTQFAIRCNTRTPRTSPPKSPPLFLQLFLLFARCQKKLLPLPLPVFLLLPHFVELSVFVLQHLPE